MSNLYFNASRDRWEGEEVPGECDYLHCYLDIDRGYSHKCSDWGCECGFFFCYAHQGYRHDSNSIDIKPDTVEWLTTILTDKRWEPFRQRFPDKVEEYRETIDDY